MGVVTPGNGDLFTVTVHKYLSTNPSEKWVNSYEIQLGLLGATGGTITLTAFAEAIADFERRIHLSTVQIDRVVVSTWEADSDPYSAEEFLSVPIGLPGAIAINNQALPLGIGLRIRRAVLAGRAGRLLFRGVLQEGDVEAPAGVPVLSNPASIQTRLTDAINNSEILVFLDVGINVLDDVVVAIVMAHLPPNSVEPIIRAVKTLDLNGVAFNKLSMRWFNRG